MNTICNHLKNVNKHIYLTLTIFISVAPEIDVKTLRAATGAGEVGRLPCRVKSVPPPRFTWTRNGQQVIVNKTSKYMIELKSIDRITFESWLVIENVAPSDYGTYECSATNEMGSSKENVRLDITSAPDQPQNLTVIDVTHDSVTLNWIPSFDGGMKASYRVRYREASSEHYKYQDARANMHKMTITGLKMNTLYLFSITATNELGSSRYLPDLTRAQTKGKKT